MNTRDGRISALWTAYITGSLLCRFSISGSRPGLSSVVCRTIKTAAGKSQGSADRTVCSTCRLPADPPMTTMSLCAMVHRWSLDAETVVRRGATGKQHRRVLVNSGGGHLNQALSRGDDQGVGF